MSLVLVNASCWVGGFDFTGDTSKIQLIPEVEEKDDTRFGQDGWHSVAPGLKTVAFEQEGYISASMAPDAEAWTELGVTLPATVSPDGTEGSTAYLLQALRLGYHPEAELGELLAFSLTGRGSDPVGIVRGQVARAKGTVSATGQLGSVLDLGAPGAGQYVYATLHVFQAGTTITVQVQSDDSAAFSSPTTRATLGPITTVGGTWMTRVPGPLAGETHWRLHVSAITGSFVVAGAIAVQ